MPTTKINKESAKTALNNMKTVMPQDNELNNAFAPTIEIINPISTIHDGFLNEYIVSIESGGEIYQAYEKANTDFTKLISNVSDAITTIEEMDQNGTVEQEDTTETPTEDENEIDDSEDTFSDDYDEDFYTGSDGGSYGYSGSSPYSSQPSGESSNVTIPPTDQESEEQSYDSTIEDIDDDIEESYLEEPTTDSSNITSSMSAAINSILEQAATTQTQTVEAPPATITTPTIITGGAVASLAAALPQNEEPVIEKIEVSGIPYTDDNAFGSHTITQEAWNNLSEEEKALVTKKLKELGFSDSEIKEILNGKASIPKLTLDALTKSLEEAIKNNPTLREDILKRYGIDIFNSNGTINQEKLSIALLMDNAKSNDKYSLIELLHSKYNVDIVDSSLYNDLATRLTKYLTTSPSLRQKIIDRYGFDIFNDDGTINRDKLSLAILMDKQTTNDQFDLTKLLDELFGEETLPPVSTTPQVVRIDTPQTPTKKKKSSSIPILLGLGAAGAVGGGIYLANKNKEKTSEDEEDDESYYEEDYENVDNSTDSNDDYSYEARPEGKKWLNGLGVDLDEDNLEIDKDSSTNISNETLSDDSNEIAIDRVKPKYAEEKDKSILPYLGAAAGAALIGKETYDNLEDKKKKEETNNEQIMEEGEE